MVKPGQTRSNQSASSYNCILFIGEEQSYLANKMMDPVNQEDSV